MAKPTGAVCNLDCAYCFFLTKEQLYPGSSFRMSDDVQEAYIRQVLEAQSQQPEAVVSWQGGEPTLMGLEFFQRSLELERRCARPGQHVLNTLQTNGTLLDDEWGRFLARNGFLVGISVDGPRELHDAYRVDKGGKPTFDRVVRGAQVLERHRVDWNVLTAVHAANGDHGAEVYRFLRDELGARFVQLIPVVERATGQAVDAVASGRTGHRPLYTQEGTRVTPRSVGPEQFGRFLVEVFDIWVREDIGRVYVQMFDSTLASWCGEPGSMCVHAETCGQQLALEQNGDVYSCDHYVEPAYLLGNIGERHVLELVELPQQQRFGIDKRDALTDYCRDCDVRAACNGGCPKDRFAASPYGEPGHNYLCPGYQLFFRHVRRPMQEMAALLRQGRSPAELMELDQQHPEETVKP
jgi:uncharacterized protein